ncbi:hypothetical protein AGMMS50289_23890 [Betaproteobacteria bacterium]|nr:hypothetical protein AGMMS50289_23890 [Betaproteobacteria bacterium]
MRYSWVDLTPRRFEELAMRFLQEKYPKDWTLLPQSGDGNRDVENVQKVSTFGQDMELLEWAEAKHTNQANRRLQKGQLDPTIVSAILNKRVVALLFISNGYYPDSYIPRAEQALMGRLMAGPYFIDGSQLEQWLDQHPDLADDYFSKIPQQPEENVNPLEIIDVRLVSMTDYGDGHMEYRDRLKRTEQVVLLAIVRAIRPMRVGLTLDASCLELDLNKFPTKLELRGGLQSIPLCVKAVLECAQGSGTVLIHSDGADQPVIGKFHYAIGATVEVTCASQITALQKLHEILDAHTNHPRPGCLRLVGDAASGKSWVQRKLMEEHALTARVRRLVFGAASGENARTLCRSLLFLSFGAAADFSGLENGGRIPTQDLPIDVIKSLYQGVNTSDQAADVLERLLASEEVTATFTRMDRGDPKVLLLDDLHKADELSLRVLRHILKRLADSDNRTLLVLAHRSGFNALNDNIIPLLRCDIRIDPVNEDDIHRALQQVLPSPVVPAVQEQTCEVIHNVLELSSFIDGIRTRNVSNKHSTSDVLNDVRHALVEASVGHIAARLSGKSEETAADLVAIVEGGVEDAFLRQRFGDQTVDALLDSKLFHLLPDRNGALTRVVPAHDLLQEAYLSRRDVYSTKLAEHIGSLMDTMPHRRPDLLIHLCRCGSHWRRRYLFETLSLRDKLLQQTCFGRARGMSEALYNLLRREGRRALSLTEDQHLAVLFGYANCVNHTEGSGSSMRFFNETAEAAHHYPRSVTTVDYACRAAAELFNVRFWQIEIASLSDDIEIFLRDYENLDSSLRSAGWADGIMTAINRLMMVHYLKDEPDLARLTFERGRIFAEKFACPHDQANLLMDEAKCLFRSEPKRALEQMEAALNIYEDSNTQVRRLAVCRAQLAYLRARLRLADIAFAETEARALVDAGFMQEYANSTLQAGAVYLVSGDLLAAQAHLQQVVIQKSALRQNPRREMLWHHLAGVAAALEGDVGTAQKYFQHHQQLAQRLGLSYREIATHNLRIIHLSPDRAVWADDPISAAFWLDPRLW